MSFSPRRFAKNKLVIISSALTILGLIWKGVNAASNLDFLYQALQPESKVAKFMLSSRGADLVLTGCLLFLVLTILFEYKSETTSDENDRIKAKHHESNQQKGPAPSGEEAKPAYSKDDIAFISAKKIKDPQQHEYLYAVFKNNGGQSFKFLKAQISYYSLDGKFINQENEGGWRTHGASLIELKSGEVGELCIARCSAPQARGHGPFFGASNRLEAENLRDAGRKVLVTVRIIAGKSEEMINEFEFRLTLEPNFTLDKALKTPEVDQSLYDLWPDDKPHIIAKVEEAYRTGGLPSSGPYPDWYVFVRLYVRNLNVATSLQSFRLRATLDGITYTTDILSTEGWSITRKEHHPVFFSTAERSLSEPILDLRRYRDEPLLKNVGRDGWLRFQIQAISSHRPVDEIAENFDATIYITDSANIIYPVKLAIPHTYAQFIKCATN